MMCIKPFKQGYMEFGCGQCLPCRINRRRIWTTRLVLESCLHPASLFVTLTYDDEHLPPGGTLRREDLQAFWKKLRFSISPVRIRYYCCGEYGERYLRPHYHAAIFGIGRSFAGVVDAAWGLGMIHVGDLTMQSAHYIVGYVTKGLTKKGDDRLGDRIPEFARMSLKPGIGAGAIKVLGEATTSIGGARTIAKSFDVPVAVRFGGRLMPIGRYLRGLLREESGFNSRKQPEMAAILQRYEEVQKWMDEQEFERRKQKREQTVSRAKWRQSFELNKRKL